MPLTTKHLSFCFAAVLIFATTLVVTTPTSAADETLPTRKSGLWEQKTVMDQGEGPQEHTMTICIEKSMEVSTAKASIKSHKENCSQYEITKKDGKTTVVSECVFNGRNVSSSTTMSGDFQKNFTIAIKSRTTIDDGRQSRVLNRTIDQQGTYLKADCGDLKPGEAMGSNGDRIMVQ